MGWILCKAPNKGEEFGKKRKTCAPRNCVKICAVSALTG